MTGKMEMENNLPSHFLTLQKIKPDWTLIGKSIATMLSENIDALYMEKNRRLVIVQDARKKLSGEGSFKFHAQLFYIWNYIADFMDDFFAEVKKITGHSPKKEPPRIVILTPENPVGKPLIKFLSFYNERAMDVDVYSYDKEKTNGEQLLWPLSQDIVQSAPQLDERLHRKFSREHALRWKATLHFWESIVANIGVVEILPLPQDAQKALKSMRKRYPLIYFDHTI